MTIRELQLTSDDIRRQASRVYIRERVAQNMELHLRRVYVRERIEQVRAEVRRETREEIRAAIARVMDGDR